MPYRRAASKYDQRPSIEERGAVALYMLTWPNSTSDKCWWSNRSSSASAKSIGSEVPSTAAEHAVCTRISYLDVGCSGWVLKALSAGPREGRLAGPRYRASTRGGGWRDARVVGLRLCAMTLECFAADLSRTYVCFSPNIDDRYIRDDMPSVRPE